MADKHHYVPAFYFKPWLEDDDKLWQCRTGRDGSLSHRRVGRRSISFVWDHNTLHPEISGHPGAEHDTVEKAYSKLETKAASVRDRLLAGTPPSGLSDPERVSWAEFIATLEHRHPARREHAEAEATIAINELKARLGSSGDRPFKENVLSSIDFLALGTNAAKAAPLVHKAILAEPILTTLTWACIKIAPSSQFFTSDRPLGIYTHASSRVCLTLPISPDMMFVAMGLKDGDLERKQYMHEVAGQLAFTHNLKVIYDGPRYLYSKQKLRNTHHFQYEAAAKQFLQPWRHPSPDGQRGV